MRNMIKKLAGLSIVLACAALPAYAQRITIDYAHDFPFETVKTFHYVDTKDTDARDSLMDGRIRDAIIRELKAGNLRQVESDADLYVTYHLTKQDYTSFTTTGFGYGGYYGRGWGGGLGTTTTTSNTYTEGTLILDAYEPRDKKMVWRGTGTVTLKSKPEKVANQIQKIMTKMGKKWQKILAKQDK